MEDDTESDIELDPEIKVEMPPICKESGLFDGDLTRLMLLVMLYSIQGVSFGFLVGTLPIMLKNHFSYTEIGIMSMCGLPYTIKFLFSPLVDTKFIKCIGRRRTWIIPGQLLAASMLYCIGVYYDKLAEGGCLYTLTTMFTITFLALAFQDIAVDGWAVTIVKKKNLANSASCQLLGLSIGSFFGTTIYLAFNSVDFCNNFIFSTPSEDPLLNVRNFLKGWSILIVLVTCYLAIFQSEKNDRQKVDEKDLVTDVGEIVSITIGILRNRNMQTYLFFICMSFATSSFSSLVGTTYLLNDLKYEQDKLSYISMINFPFGIIISIFIGKYVYDKPLSRYYYSCIAVTVGEIIGVNMLFANYDQLKGTYFDVCLLSLTLISSFGYRILSTSQMCFANKLSNIAIASTQITLFNSLGNMMAYIPNIYSFAIVDYFGLYWPNLIGSILNILILLCFKGTVEHLEQVPKEQWMDSDKDGVKKSS